MIHQHHNSQPSAGGISASSEPSTEKVCGCALIALIVENRRKIDVICIVTGQTTCRIPSSIASRAQILPEGVHHDCTSVTNETDCSKSEFFAGYYNECGLETGHGGILTRIRSVYLVQTLTSARSNGL